MTNLLRDTTFSGRWLPVCLLIVVATWQGAKAQPLHSKPEIKQTDSKPLLVKEYHLDARGMVNVFTVSGNIDLVSVPQTHTVRIELYADRGFTLWPRGDSFDNYRITNLKRGNEITATVEKKHGRESGFWGVQTSFSYKIKVPSSVCTNLKTLNGHIRLENVDGQQILKSNAGNIQVRGVQGTVKAYTSGGNIAIDNSRGTVFVRADGGNIKARNIYGELRLRSNGGEVSSTGISGSMVAVVSGGNIDARFNRVTQGINLVAHGGSVHLAVPQSSGYNLSATGHNVEFPQPELFKGTYSGTMARGLINGGGIPVDIVAQGGNVIFKFKE